MFQKIGNASIRWANSVNPWTNVYGLARTIIALSTAITLAVNPSWIFFKPAAGVSDYRHYTPLNYFCLVPFNYTYLEIMRWIAVILLLLVASGWRPRITGIIHWWITFSLQTSAVTLDGGEQVATVITLMLLPITLTDKRKWHWDSTESSDPMTNSKFIKRIIALTCFLAIRFQVSIIYLNAATAKLFDADWLNGTAVYYYMGASMLGLPSNLYKLFYSVLTNWTVIIPTWGTIIVELLLFSGLFIDKKYRVLLLILGITLHVIFAIMLGLYSFSMIMSAALILYLRPVGKKFTFKSVDLTPKVKTTAELPLMKGGDKLEN
ncbi:hypothetical protein E4665_15920 [Sporolactobacillus shoreae]|uniref:HTTM-like domain-containing protein n=1 Tax=Sporolactobacillus shoreae TaxID=1465501 RepID=A0A4Z0GIG7_9BACL|nr:sporulation-delaying protein SdpB family protein [Sporolactobacillus shoreae]TGA96350.1 hypothetical protein E4665_15920 [Sporolactobacillus shoreae]